MIEYRDECVGCDRPCIGAICPYKAVPYLVCDECGEEANRLYEVDGRQLCRDCAAEEVLSTLPVIEKGY